MKKMLLKQVFAVVDVDEINEDDLGLEDVQPNDEIVGEFSVELRELWVTKFLLEEKLWKFRFHNFLNSRAFCMSILQNIQMFISMQTDD